MNEEMKEHINNLINNFNNMSYEAQQEELFDLYKTGEVEYVDVVDKYSNLVKKYKQLQNNWNELKKWLEEESKLKGSETAYLYYGKVLKQMQKLEGNNE